MNQDSLRDKIQALEIGPTDGSLTFGQRLARENGWTSEFADKVVSEYRRFLFLAATSNREVTPSDQIDQAWHLHLTYTKPYWKEFCQGILGFDLHHNPTKGGAAEQHRYMDQYRRTLWLYEDVYGEKPPADVWPPAEERFLAADRFVRVNKRDAWVIKKPNPWAETLFLVVTAPLVLIACTDGWGDNDIWFWLKVVFGVYVLYNIFSWLGSGGGKGKNSGGGGCGGFGGCGGCSG